MSSTNAPRAALSRSEGSDLGDFQVRVHIEIDVTKQLGAGLQSHVPSLRVVLRCERGLGHRQIPSNINKLEKPYVAFSKGEPQIAIDDYSIQDARNMLSLAPNEAAYVSTERRLGRMRGSYRFRPVPPKPF